MPKMQDSSGPDMTGWAPTNPPTQQTQQPTIPEPGDRSPFMVASMPSMASGGDLTGSQFYPKTQLPLQRILPVKGANQ